MCMHKLEVLLHACEVAFNAQDHLIMCFLHIMHICVTHVLKSFTQSDLTVIVDAWTDAFDDEENCEAYMEAVR